MHIFISYAKKDTKELAVRLRNALIALPGITAWMDESLETGGSWARQIERQINRCDLFIVLLSPDVNREETATQDRSFVLNEIDYARYEVRKPILPVMAQRTRLPVQLAGAQYIDITQNQDAGIERLVEEVCKRAGIESPRQRREHEQREAQARQQAILEEQRRLQEEAERAARQERLEREQREKQIRQQAIREVRTPPISPRPQPASNWQFTWIAMILVLLLLAIAGTRFLAGILEDNDEPGGQATDTSTSVANLPTDDSSDSPPFPTITPALSERDRAIQLAWAGVDSNDEWTPYIEEINGVEMVLVPKGCFMMGSTDEQIDYAVSLGASRDAILDEQPAHQQCFDEPFWIDRYEVTNAQFREFNGQAAQESAWIFDNRPRENITWFEARDFCESRDARLPTEREWEYAARGPDSLIYPWGNEFVAENVVYTGNSANQTVEAGSRPGGISWVGALDLSGNVWEWVSTLYQEQYPYSEESESNINTNDLPGLRGGSWDYSGNDVRAAGRSMTLPDYWHYGLGVRCALSFNS